MIVAINSRTSVGYTGLFFAEGSYDWGLLDAGTAGVASMRIRTSANHASRDILRTGSIVHVFPQFGLPSWMGYITDVTRDARANLYQVQAVELYQILGSIQNISTLHPPAGSTQGDRGGGG